MYDSKNRQCDGNKNKKQQKIQAKVLKTLHTVYHSIIRKAFEMMTSTSPLRTFGYVVSMLAADSKKSW